MNRPTVLKLEDGPIIVALGSAFWALVLFARYASGNWTDSVLSLRSLGLLALTIIVTASLLALLRILQPKGSVSTAAIGALFAAIPLAIIVVLPDPAKPSAAKQAVLTLVAAAAVSVALHIYDRRRKARSR